MISGTFFSYRAGTVVFVVVVVRWLRLVVLISREEGWAQFRCVSVGLDGDLV